MLKERVNHWLDSDLVGIPATLYTFGVLAVSLAVFRFGGPIAGIVVAIALWVPMVVFAIRGAGRPPAPLGVRSAVADGHHRVLVLANQGLEDPDLCSEVCRRADHSATEAMVLSPVFVPSRFGALADDVGEEDVRPAERRVAAAIRELQRHGVEASGHVSVAEPMQAALDGLREFPANELIILPGRESGWEHGEDLVRRLRAEIGLPVTVIDSRERRPVAEGDARC